MMNLKNYSPGVLIGNWFETVRAKELRVNDMQKQRGQKKLILDETRSLYDRFRVNTVLGPPQEYVVFGGVMQLIPVRINLTNTHMSDIKLALSLVINQQMLHKHSQSINELCELSLAPAPSPCLRNTFRVVGPANGLDRPAGNYLTYGEKFRLQCMEPDDDPMYLFSAQKLCNLTPAVNRCYSTTRNGEESLPLGIIAGKNCGVNAQVPSANANFFCIHYDLTQRIESEGRPIPVNTPLVIVHAVTNRNLAAENVVLDTLFGPEFMVSVQNYRNIFKRETWKNHWQFTYG
ncbi:cilia- and flagella-associated protein 161 [Drosophila tropicalis]|uniref:cilia- and flagella-associated protein 161 n=1 Tax=Drosophila tropicalis TaxID=46794 RepID=UPI0035ABCA5A